MVHLEREVLRSGSSKQSLTGLVLLLGDRSGTGGRGTVAVVCLRREGGGGGDNEQLDLLWHSVPPLLLGKANLWLRSLDLRSTLALGTKALLQSPKCWVT